MTIRIHQLAAVYRTIRRPDTLATLLTIWFLSMFAPIVCIVHCQVLPGSLNAADVLANPPLHRVAPASTSFVPAPSIVLAVCHFVASDSGNHPTLPPISSLPPVVYDLALATLAFFWLLAVRRTTTAAHTHPPRAPRRIPPVPPPKRSLVPA